MRSYPLIFDDSGIFAAYEFIHMNLSCMANGERLEFCTEGIIKYYLGNSSQIN